jgi:hypothetical protein
VLTPYLLRTSIEYDQLPRRRRVIGQSRLFADKAVAAPSGKRPNCGVICLLRATHNVAIDHSPVKAAGDVRKINDSPLNWIQFHSWNPQTFLWPSQTRTTKHCFCSNPASPIPVLANQTLSVTKGGTSHLILHQSRHTAREASLSFKFASLLFFLQLAASI